MTVSRVLFLAPLVGLTGPLAAASSPPPQDPTLQDPALTAPPDDPVAAGRVLKLTLADALRIAVQNNIDLDLEELSTEIARFDAYGSWGAFDPTFTASGSWSEQDTQATNAFAGGVVVTDDSLGFDTSLNVPLKTGASLDLSLNHSNDATTNTFATFDTSTTDVVTAALTQPLLRGAWRRYNTSVQREAEIAHERQMRREQQIRAQLVLDVVNAYWDLVMSTEELTVRQLSVDLANTQLDQDERRLEVGTGTEVDVLQSQTNLAQQEEQLINASFLLKQAEDNLRRLLFQRPEGDLDRFLDEWETQIEALTPLPVIRDLKLDWGASLERAIELRPELWQQRLDIDAAEVRLQRSRSDRLPLLDARVSSRSTGFDSDPAEAFDTAIGWEFARHEASLTFSVPIPNRTARYAVRSARAALRQAQLTYDRQELDILSEVRDAVRDVSYRTESVEAAEKSAELSEKQLRAEEARQEIGLSTTFQVLDFQRNLAESRSALVAARAAYAKALARLRFAEGRLEDTPIEELAAGDGER